jgi:hypothetical protein
MAMDLINALLLIVGGILALSGIIVANQPNAKNVIDKLVPYQAIIGVALLVLGVFFLMTSGDLSGVSVGAQSIRGPGEQSTGTTEYISSHASPSAPGARIRST